MELSTENAHANDFEDYVEPFEDEGMSEEEEDYLDYLLGDENEQIQDPDEVWQPPEVYMSSQSSLESMSSMGEPTPTSVYWKDDNVKDEGAPDPRTVQFRPGRKPGIHLGRLSRQTMKSLNTPINFFRLFLTNMLVTSLCIATNQHAEFLIRSGNFKSYARSDGTWERVAEAEMERFIGILIYMSFMKLSSLDRYWSTDPLYRFNPISSCMTSLRFKAILAFLQITPLPDVDKDDKLTRVQPLIDHVRRVSQDIFQPYEKITVDERMVRSKHKFSGIRQFMKANL